MRILEGPTGSGCAMTSREVYDRVGGFGRHKKLVFWHEAAAYVQAVRKLGYRTAILEELEVWHAGSPYYSRPSVAKVSFHDHRARAVARKDFVKRTILRIPFAAGAERALRLVRAAASLRAARVRPSTRVSGGLFGRADRGLAARGMAFPVCGCPELDFRGVGSFW